MLVRSVASIDDWRITHARQMLRGSGHRMPDHNAVRRHRFKIASCVEQRLALRDTRSRYADVYCVGRKTFSSNLKRGAGPGGRFEEKIDNSATPEGGNFLDFAF